MIYEKTASGTDRPRPKIALSAEDHKRLSQLVNAAMTRMPEIATILADELDRARVVAGKRHPQHTVGMGSHVEFRDDTTGKIQRVTLVYPDEADISLGKVSVLTPVGTALIGLRVNDSITWQTRSGDVRQLTVLASDNDGDGDAGPRTASKNGET